MEGISGSSKREAGWYQGKRGGKDEKGGIKLTAEFAEGTPHPRAGSPFGPQAGYHSQLEPCVQPRALGLAAVERKRGGLGRALDKLTGEKRKGCEWEAVANHKHLCKRG